MQARTPLGGGVLSIGRRTRFFELFAFHGEVQRLLVVRSTAWGWDTAPWKRIDPKVVQSWRWEGEKHRAEPNEKKGCHYEIKM